MTGRIPSQAGICSPAGVAVYGMRQDVFFPSPGFPGEMLGLSPPGAELDCSHRSDPGGGAG